MPVWVEPAPAKVNLYLSVVGRRADGYHLLDSLAVFPAIGDVLRVEPDPIFSLVLDGPFGAALQAEPDNLVLRAGRALAAFAGITPHGRLTLTKHLPVASGIGGGSSDAAAALRLLQRFWNVSPTPDRLAEIAIRLGADVPVCLAAAAARMQGVGECLTAAPRLPQCGMVLVNPGIAIATQAVFRARSATFSTPPHLPAAWPNLAAMAHDLDHLTNDLEPPAISLCPVVAEVLATLRGLPGCALARMSGSGATCFALFETAEAAATAATAITHPGWWRWGGALA